MPRKKKSFRLSCKSAAAIKSQRQRAQESEEQRQRRLAAQRERYVYQLQRETLEQRQARLARSAARAARVRSGERPASRSARLARDAARAARYRSRETPAIRSARLAVNAARVRSVRARARLQQSREHREERSSSDAQRHASARGRQQSKSSLAGRESRTQVLPSVQMYTSLKGATGGNVDPTPDPTSANGHADPGMDDRETRVFGFGSQTRWAGGPGQGVCANVPVKLEPGVNFAPSKLPPLLVKTEIAVAEEVLYHGIGGAGDTVAASGVARGTVAASGVARATPTPEIEIDVADEMPDPGWDGSHAVGHDCACNLAGETAAAIGDTGQGDVTEMMIKVNPSYDDPSSSRSACARQHMDSKPERERELIRLRRLRLLARQDEANRKREAEQKTKLRQDERRKRERELRRIRLFKQKALRESKLTMSVRYL